MRAMPGIAMGPSCQAVVKLQREIGRARICSGVLLACGLRPNWQRHSDFTPSSHGLLDAPGFELSRKGRRRSQMRACDHGSSRKDSNAAESNASSAAAVEDVTEVAHSETFSRLPASVPWDGTAVAVTVVTYLGVVHGPLGVGGLSLVASLLHEPDLAPETKAASLLCLQSLEALAATWLVQSTVQEHDDAIAGRILEPQFSRVLRNRGWLPTSVLCLIGLLLVVVATSSTAACAPKHGDSVVEFVTAGGMSRTGIIAVSCLITPYLEEYMYRGFLLTSLAAYFGWPAGVLASSVVFVLAHLPLAAGGQALGLLFTGCVLGVSFVYTGNLATSLVIHSLYNATLLLALSSSSSC
ncbi:CAAX protease family protein [Marchantia polymorpha subsp. ruderalis]|uniref:CAAX prenyl protease 2/Lysostaphin resistance protein A-like domain-containing protein n=2 Tax=Marchantia polymorpha TaxID=3197 RepID=A0AAF6AU00_MARPO|nr:hypothetical protein MARPO_0061s0039 [Marchantia polymorpha]BBM99920.1 hypothetical protein Mp_1g24840 [Marchantia polymorpha subsp. ruderalis]|eukprot:PTQ36764.1 hypothetical protein MARPO_0061s0039 [Marchantia polymorpha]